MQFRGLYKLMQHFDLPLNEEGLRCGPLSPDEKAAIDAAHPTLQNLLDSHKAAGMARQKAGGNPARLAAARHAFMAAGNGAGFLSSKVWTQCFYLLVMLLEGTDRETCICIISRPAVASKQNYCLKLSTTHTRASKESIAKNAS